MTIFLEQDNKLIRLERTRVKSEKEDLQKFILRHPEIIPVDILEANDNSQIEYIAPEMNNIDILAISSSGNIYIIETKRSSGDYKRAIGQSITYAAIIWNNYGLSDEPASKFIEDFNRYIEEISDKDSWRDFQFNKIEEEKVDEEFLSSLDHELKDGRFTIIIVVDEMDDTLKNAINFLNKQFGRNMDIYAMELEYYIHDGIRIVKPHVYGVEYREASMGQKRRKWNEKLFLKAIDENADLTREQKDATKEIYHTMKELAERHLGEIKWGTGVLYGWVGLSLPPITSKAIFGITTTGNFSINYKLLENILSKKHPQLWEEIKEKLEEQLVSQGARKGTENISTKPELTSKNKEEIKKLMEWITKELLKLENDIT